MTLKKIPTRTDNSLGRQKYDKRPAQDLETEIQASEYNAVADAVIELAEAVGLDDGSIEGSLEQRMQDAAERLDEAEECCTETRDRLGIAEQQVGNLGLAVSSHETRIETLEEAPSGGVDQEARDRLDVVEPKVEGLGGLVRMESTLSADGKTLCLGPVNLLTEMSESHTSVALLPETSYGPPPPIDLLGSVVVGAEAARGSVSLDNSVIIGQRSYESRHQGQEVIAIGSNALEKGTGDGSNSIGSVAVGARALSSSQGQHNTAIGHSAGWNTHGNENIAVGDGSGYAVQGDSNISIGENAGSETNGSENIAIGPAAGAGLGGDWNTIIGAHAGQYSDSSASVAIGLGALSGNLGGSNLVALGAYALEGTQYSDAVGLGDSTHVTGNYEVQLGNSRQDVYAQDGVNTRSDARDKTDITPTALGLDFVLGLEPVDYRWDKRDDYRPPRPEFATEEDREAWEQNDKAAWLESRKLGNIVPDGTHKRTRKHHGFTAQNVKALADQLGVDFAGFQDHKVNGGEDVLSLNYIQLLAPMVKAIQEQQAIIEDLRGRLEALEGDE